VLLLSCKNISFVKKKLKIESSVANETRVNDCAENRKLANLEA
jgi:hypothetical protein